MDIENLLDGFELVGTDTEESCVVNKELSFKRGIGVVSGARHQVGPQNVVVWSNPVVYAPFCAAENVVALTKNNEPKIGKMQLFGKHETDTQSFLFSKYVDSVEWVKFHVGKTLSPKRRSNVNTLHPDMIMMFVDSRKRHCLATIHVCGEKVTCNVTLVQDFETPIPSLRMIAVSLMQDVREQHTSLISEHGLVTFPNGDSGKNTLFDVLGITNRPNISHWKRQSSKLKRRAVVFANGAAPEEVPVFIELRIKEWELCVSVGTVEECVVRVDVPQDMCETCEEVEPMIALHFNGVVTLTVFHGGHLRCFACNLPLALSPLFLCC
jgi:hypothetical protein